jgi:hypothetical protein
LEDEEAPTTAAEFAAVRDTSAVVTSSEECGLDGLTSQAPMASSTRMMPGTANRTAFVNRWAPAVALQRVEGEAVTAKVLEVLERQRSGRAGGDGKDQQEPDQHEKHPAHEPDRDAPLPARRQVTGLIWAGYHQPGDAMTRRLAAPACSCWEGG